RFVWMRLHPPRGNGEAGSKQAAPVRNTPIAFVARAHLKHWRALSPGAGDDGISGSVGTVLACLREHGALFFTDLLEASGLLSAQLESALAELVARGLVTADTFAGLRALISPQLRRADARHLRRRAQAPGI